MSIELGIAVIIGLALGVGLGWLLGSRKAAVAEGRVKELQRVRDDADKNFKAQREQYQGKCDDAIGKLGSLKTELKLKEESFKYLKDSIDKAKESLSQTFSVLASDALKDSKTELVKLAVEKINDSQKTADSGLKEIMTPLKTKLAEFQEATRQLELTRLEDKTTIGLTLESLSKQTRKLSEVLGAPKSRGNWGEIQLKRTLELAGMSEHWAYDEQVYVRDEDGKGSLADIIIRLPNGRNIIVDSKVPRNDFDAANESSDDSERVVALKAHATTVLDHVNGLASKEYWRKFESVPEFVVMFVPDDSFLASAAVINPDIFERAIKSKVVLTTPSTLYALLRAVEAGWKQQQIEEYTKLIAKHGQELYERLCKAIVLFNELGDKVGSTVTKYNELVGSVDSMLIPGAEKFVKLGIRETKKISQTKAIDRPIRRIKERISSDIDSTIEINIEDHK